MVGISWTDKDVDLPFLNARLPDYYLVHIDGHMRKKNRAKDAFLEQVYQDYNMEFPGRMDNWILPKLCKDGTEEERKKRIIKRFRDWFSNHLKEHSGNGGRRVDTLLDLTSLKGTRREPKYHAYFRLEGHRLIEDIKEDYKNYKAECIASDRPIMPVAARQNQFLAQRLKNEPSELQEQIEAARHDAGTNGAGSKFASILDVSNSATEVERQENVRKLQTNINKLIRTVVKAAETIHNETGWNIVLLTGGPEPQRGGNIHVIGTTKGSVNGMKFEDFFRDWNTLFDKFTEFCETVVPEDEYTKYSLTPLNEPWHSSMVQPDISITSTSQLNATIPDANLLESTAVDVVESQGLGAKASEGETAEFEAELIFLAATVNGIPDTIICSEPCVNSIQAPSVHPNESELSKIFNILVPAVTNPIRDMNEPILTTSKCPPSTRETRSHRKLEDQSSNEDKKVWTYDACQYLKKSLEQFQGKKLAGSLRDFEGALGNPVAKSKANKIDTSTAPLALKQWLGQANRDFWHTPSRLTITHLQDTINWYIYLQPASRGSTWPLRPFSIHESDDWSQMKKGSPLGIFLLLMSISWTPLGSPNELDKVSNLVQDVIRVLECLTSVITAESDGSKKRKAKADAGSRASSKSLRAL